jgi:ubiquinone/menaquinone biosynthesis C-methylase UbiE
MNELKIADYLKDNYKDYYEEGDSEWRRLCAFAKANNIVSLCHDLPRSAILEIGAGEGSILKRLDELHFGDELSALEISPSGAETIKAKKISRLAECKTYDGYHVPYDNDKFDIAIMSHVIEHVEHPRQLLYEASRVAQYVFIEVPLEDTIRLPGDFVFDSVGHINFYSPKTIRQLVQSCNLQVRGQITTNLPKEAYTFEKGPKGLINYYIKEVLINTLPRLATELFSYHGALVCERNDAPNKSSL